MRILITGANGCIGQYISEALIQQTDHELFLLVRDPSRLYIDPRQRSGVNVVQADLMDLAPLEPLLPTFDVAILTATAWGGSNVFAINYEQTCQLLRQLDPQRCQRVFYFSTASILNHQMQPLPEAGTLGTDYIRSKYACLQAIEELPVADRLIELFPTMVFGGGPDGKRPSFITAGMGEVLKWLWLARFFRADASFHFIHARDIAQVVLYLLQHPEYPVPRRVALGNPPITVNEMLAQLCAAAKLRVYGQIPLTLPVINFLVRVFRVQMSPWDYFCLNYRNFTYETLLNPQALGLTPYCGTVADLLRCSMGTADL
ncbi:NAD-dependent epimerase/dehydratase family protein [Thermosynechococcus vestitus]|uniref:Tlr0742 protein n=1 Tax=Thermosynechococcus vestitus (strain NIES-2133 / IAM M-273 / BP-1) TaxID=197221 RepID=Q8DKV9_THEVB|nr:NAD(P)-dependent oxidoreductase [Thermosynechococcus vestitus]BAC08293.1 tlr0742 [Thermosynechococcus vestitus BP-1]